MDERRNANDCIVWKLGGSILRRSRDYDRCAERLAAAISAEPNTRIVAVVSARYGVTNRLVRQASRIVDDTSTPEVDLLLATGELQSVAQLSMRLRRRGINCCGLTPDEIGLRIDDASGHGFTVDPTFVRRRLDAHPVVVVPGFVGTRGGGGWGTLGRGGSDLTAVALAAALDARRCDLIKDVAGYFTSDPNVDATAVHLAHVSYARALEMAATGCDLVQTEALRHAGERGLELILRTLDGDVRRTTVSERVTAPIAEASASRGGDSLYGVIASLAAAAP